MGGGEQSEEQKQGQRQRAGVPAPHNQSQHQGQRQRAGVPVPHSQSQHQDQGQRAGVTAPHPSYVPWIMAVAVDWRERRRRNPKRRGEMSQAAFLVKAQAMGFGVAVPWGDSEKCDFIVWSGDGGPLLRVQVKGTGRLHGGGYDVQPVYATRSKGKRGYTKKEIDVLAAHVAMPRDEAWYLFPVGAVAGEKNLRLFPGLKGKDPRWERYLEAWGWLEG